MIYNNEFSSFQKQPNTQLVDVSFNLSGHKIGVTVLNDIIGFDKSQNIKLRYAQQFKLTENSYFSLRLGTDAIHNYLNISQMAFEFPNDPLQYSDYNYTRMDFDIGAELQLKNLFLGLSSLHLGKQFLNPNNDSPAAHYYFYGQYAINSKNSFRFFPNFLFRQWKNTFWGEGSMIVFYKNITWIGGTYTRHHDLTLNTGLRLGKFLMFGYAFKTNLNPEILNAWTNNSHEVFLNFSINKTDRGIKTPRFVD